MKRFNLHFTRFIVLALMLFIAIPDVFAQAKNGEATLKVGNYATVSISSVYQTTLARSTSIQYSWYSDNTSVASVSGQSMTSCTVYGISQGSCRVYYQCSYRIDGYYRTMNFYYDITVQSNGPTSITVNPGSTSLYEGDECTLSATLSGGTSSITWSTDNSSVLSVSGSGTRAYVTAKKEGKAYVYARTANGLSDYCYVTVMKKIVTPTSITLPATASVNEGEYTTISASVYPSNASYSLTWSSANTDIATVSSSGRVYGKKVGTVKITAKIDGYNLSDYCNVTVNSKAIIASNLDISMPSVLEIGESYSLSPSVTPDNSTVSYSYKSSNNAVATVNASGVVTACGEGSSVITVTEKNSGLTATAKIDVLTNSWAGTYTLNASVETSQHATTDYPEKFSMIITRSNYQYLITSFLFNDEEFERFNDGGIPVNVTSKENGEIDISTYSILTYDRETFRIYVICAYDEEADDWTNKVPLFRNGNGSLQLGDFYVASFEYDKSTDSYATSGYVEALYYNISTSSTKLIDGDVNGDGEVNGTDLVTLANIILGRGEMTSEADVNGDGEVNGTDYVKLTNIILGRSASRKRRSTKQFKGDKLSYKRLLKIEQNN